ncbi:hypothetical protein PG993_010415 [Apiospora rasikravindrae]|uniref:Uncharacterized protein n=1 Tax=Apiospora rasikravindrae TaxID=990691 RepID=A0ABR1SNZ7_9PEZI
MKFSLIASFVFLALGSAELQKVRRQTQPSVEDAAMSDTSGNAVSFDTAGVNMAMKNSGQ